MKHILILEDDIQLATQWQRALATRYEVSITHGAEHALLVFKQNQIDLCIVDLFVRRDGELSQDGGIKFLGSLRLILLELKRKVPVLGVSGASRGSRGIDAEAHLSIFGSEKFLEKPFSEQELLDAVDSLLE